MANYCTNCGSELPPDASFCTHCGHPVTAGPAGQEDRNQTLKLNPDVNQPRRNDVFNNNDVYNNNDYYAPNNNPYQNNQVYSPQQEIPHRSNDVITDFRNLPPKTLVGIVTPVCIILVTLIFPILHGNGQNFTVFSLCNLMSQYAYIPSIITLPWLCSYDIIYLIALANLLINRNLESFRKIALGASVFTINFAVYGLLIGMAMSKASQGIAGIGSSIYLILIGAIVCFFCLKD